MLFRYNRCTKKTNIPNHIIYILNALLLQCTIKPATIQNHSSDDDGLFL